MLVAGAGMSGIVALIAATPLGEAWYIGLERIPADGMDLARVATWLLIPMPFLTFLISYWQGLLVDVHETRPISEGVAIGLGTIALVLVAFVGLGTLGGAVAATLAIAQAQTLVSLVGAGLGVALVPGAVAQGGRAPWQVGSVVVVTKRAPTVSNTERGTPGTSSTPASRGTRS
mgnify:CR=1 FL=1